MKNSYQASGYCYGLVRSEAFKHFIKKESFNQPKNIQFEPKWIVDYDAVAGLTTEDLLDYDDLTVNGHIKFVMYDKIGSIATIRYHYDINLKEIINDPTIDDVITRKIEQDIYEHRLIGKIYNRALGFLEKYVYETTSETYK